jgi:cytochrome c1
MRYNRLTDLGIDISMIEDNLMFATDKSGETMTVAMTAKDAKAWFGAPPPDLSVESRVRGADWLYNYFWRSIATSPRRPAGTTSCSRTSPCRTCCGRRAASTSCCRPNTRATTRRSPRRSR